MTAGSARDKACNPSPVDKKHHLLSLFQAVLHQLLKLYTHTLEVAQIARTIARALKMNESLTEAIALGHDLGHTPFGHIS